MDNIVNSNEFTKLEKQIDYIEDYNLLFSIKAFDSDKNCFKTIVEALSDIDHNNLTIFNRKVTTETLNVLYAYSLLRTLRKISDDKGYENPLFYKYKEIIFDFLDQKHMKEFRTIGYKACVIYILQQATKTSNNSYFREIAIKVLYDTLNACPELKLSDFNTNSKLMDKQKSKKLTIEKAFNGIKHLPAFDKNLMGSYYLLLPDLNMRLIHLIPAIERSYEDRFREIKVLKNTLYNSDNNEMSFKNYSGKPEKMSVFRRIKNKFFKNRKTLF